MSSAPALQSRKGSLAAAVGAGSLSWQQVHIAIVALGQPADVDQLQQLCSLLERFVVENEDPKTSPHLRASGSDRLEPLVALLERKDVARASPEARLLALKALKILARRQDVRLRCTQQVLDVLVPLLDAGTGADGGAMAGEAANGLANLAYEEQNASAVVRAGGAPRLLKLLSAGAAGAEAHVNAAGALQTLSFMQDGRAALLKAGGPAAVLHRLASTRSLQESIKGQDLDGAGAGAGASEGAGGAGGAGCTSPEASSDGSEGRLLQRLVGALHNLSSGADGTASIRQQGGITLIVALLRCKAAGVAASAAGALQNMSREAASRADIRAQPGAVASLVELLTGPNMQAAVCAAATLVNLCDGLLEGGEEDRERLSQILAGALAGALAGGAVVHSLRAGEGLASTI